MRHDWIFEVLNDLRSYARKNDLPATAEQADRTLEVARAEIAAQARPFGEGDGEDDPPSAKQPN